MSANAQFCGHCGQARDGLAPSSDTVEFDTGRSSSAPGRRWVIPVVVGVVIVALIAGGLVALGQRSHPHHRSAALAVAHTSSPTPTPTPTPTPSPSITPTPTPSAVSFAALYSQDKSGVVKILASTCDGSGEGTGFVIGRRLIATVAHVVNGEVAMAIKAGHSTYTGRVIGIDNASDVALIHTTEPLSGYVFHFDSASPAVGDQLAVVGYPLDGPLTFSSGSVSGLHRRLDIESQERSGLLQTDAAINPGNSGGPLITSDGAVAGLVDAKATHAEGLGYAVTTSTATPLLDAWRASPAPPAAATCSDALGPQDGSEVAPTVPGDSSVDASLSSTLATYFDGINDGDYTSAYNAETTAAHHGESAAAFAEAVASSYDTDITVTGVDQQPDGVYVIEIVFTSVQEASQGPDGDTCDVWDLDYQLVPEPDDRYLINRARSATGGPGYESCSG
jgi:S1-C subfamily serine protease